MFDSLPKDARAVRDWRWEQYAPYFAILQGREIASDNRSALALDGTVSLPDLFGAAGAQFKFDAATVQNIVSFLETEINRLQAISAK